MDNRECLKIRENIEYYERRLKDTNISKDEMKRFLSAKIILSKFFLLQRKL